MYAEQTQRQRKRRKRRSNKKDGNSVYFLVLSALLRVKTRVELWLYLLAYTSVCFNTEMLITDWLTWQRYSCSVAVTSYLFSCHSAIKSGTCINLFNLFKTFFVNKILLKYMSAIKSRLWPARVDNTSKGTRLNVVHINLDDLWLFEELQKSHITRPRSALSSRLWMSREQTTCVTSCCKVRQLPSDHPRSHRRRHSAAPGRLAFNQRLAVQTWTLCSDETLRNATDAWFPSAYQMF